MPRIKLNARLKEFNAAHSKVGVEYPHYISIYSDGSGGIYASNGKRIVKFTSNEFGETNASRQEKIDEGLIQYRAE